jgi:trehalose 6-phosphate phosphatase
VTTGTFTPSDVVASAVVERLRESPVLLLTDFDGTLAELAPRPEDAVMTPEVRRQLERIAALPAVTLGAVSGRRLTDVSAKVGPAAEFVGGLHGLEIVGPGEVFVHPALEAAAPAVREAFAVAIRELDWCPGLIVEDKTFSLTCHVRQATDEDGVRALEQFEELAAPYVERGVVRLLPGAKATELVPNVDWHKGKAVAWIRDRVAGRLGRDLPVIYLGDDRTDEDAFAALSDTDLAIGVGPRPHSHLITWRLAGPASVGRFLSRLGDGLVFHRPGDR